MSYNGWMASILGLYAIAMFATFGTATNPCLWQTLSWVSIKAGERGVWTGFVYLLRKDFRHYASIISFSDNRAEAILYIAVLPLLFGASTLILFSNIARMHIPFVNIKVLCCCCLHEFASDIMAQFDMKEALKVGIFSTLVYNGILYLVAAIALRSWRATAILLLMMVVVPVLTCAIFTLFLWVLLKDMHTWRPVSANVDTENSVSEVAVMYASENTNNL
ncbi:hypothetical protein RFI_16243 [Reticulomyxa filosa]|uniref:Uncharacterized protein n=1 Tax=Reticulomyxa filosa TaxID=46433 RepID=X6N3W5_RETFI|nr:hypothetical protein RFI_16243 [Reticulomyxa filosa]|eukprot:ETO20965.1 hypothetical protein RFI_16243 [Reticulomyxa filosa]